jgi:hypothetical protein
MDITPGTNYGGPGFKSRPGDLLYWLVYFFKFLEANARIVTHIKQQEFLWTSSSVQCLQTTLFPGCTQLEAPPFKSFDHKKWLHNIVHLYSVSRSAMWRHIEVLLVLRNKINSVQMSVGLHQRRFALSFSLPPPLPSPSAVSCILVYRLKSRLSISLPSAFLVLYQALYKGDERIR